MTPSELYAREPEEVSRSVEILSGYHYSHVPEVADSGTYALRDVQQDRVEIRYYRNHYFDGRRIWVLASVWFDDAPVMIIQNAGREGDDHHARFVTDGARYTEMVRYLAGCIAARTEAAPETAALDADLSLTEFYGNRLDGWFGRY